MGLYCLLSSVYHVTGRGEKSLIEIPCKYNYNGGPTKDPALSRDPVFNFVIMLIPSATKRDQIFIRDRP